jgi:CBS domain-containing protein
MPRNTPVSAVMTTEVLSFAPGDNVGDAMARLVDRSIDGAPVVDADNQVVGVISTGDLIVQETELHVPTVISLFGATLELPSAHKHFEDDLRKTLGATVADVMHTKPVTVGPDETIEAAATKLHEHNVSRLPVVGPGGLVGIISRVDVLREIIRDDEDPAPDA